MTSAYFEDEDKLPGSQEVGWRTALRHLAPLLTKHRWRLGLCLGLLLGATFLSLAWPYLIQQAIDGPLQVELSREAGEPRFRPLLLYGAAILVIQALALLFLYLQRVKLEGIGQDIMLDLRRRLFHHILRLDIGFFDQNPVGRLMARVESDTESLRLLFTNTVVLVVGDLILVAGIWAVMLYKHTQLALVVLGAFPLISGLIYIFHRLTTHRFLEVRKRMADVTATLAELLHGMSIIQIFHRGEYARRMVFRANERKFGEDAFVGIAVCVFFNTLFLFEYIKIGLILLLGAMWGVTAGVIVLFVLLIWKEFEPIARTADQLGSFQKGIAGARRIFSLLEVKPKLADPDEPVVMPPIRQGIRFENVWFSYTQAASVGVEATSGHCAMGNHDAAGTDNATGNHDATGDHDATGTDNAASEGGAGNDDWVLKDVSFEIPAGQRVALVGVTGGGKSTIISLLLRLYDPQRGRILIDGVDIRKLRRADLRRRCALVLQDIILFPGDVHSNISLESNDLTLEQVKAAARTVDADRFIERLPQGYRTEVSEKGANFSRGERQLLSFARALAVNPDLLILDEATSSVDPETERVIQASLGKLMKGRTSLIIAHRLATILDADRILVLKAGRILEEGTHERLLARGGYYAKLYHLQLGTENGEICHVV